MAAAAIAASGCIAGPKYVRPVVVKMTTQWSGTASRVVSNREITGLRIKCASLKIHARPESTTWRAKSCAIESGDA